METEQDKIIKRVIIRLVATKELSKDEIDKFRQAILESNREDDPEMYDAVIEMIEKWNKAHG